MLIRKCVVVAALGAVGLIPSTHGQAITSLGMPPGASYSRGRAISGDGSTVAGWCSMPGGNRAFRWTSAGEMLDLGTFSGGTHSEAFALSADGSAMAGFSHGREGPDGPFYAGAFRWTQSSGMQYLGVLPGGLALSVGTGISADGSVVSGYSTSADGRRAVRWTEGGGMQSLGVLPDQAESVANGISADGLAVVGWSFSTNSATRAFLWTESSGMQDLGIHGQAYAVNADGSAVTGTSGLELSNAFRWTATGGMEDLGALPDDGGSEGFAISGDGSVVVGASHSFEGNSTAFLWTQSMGMVDMNTYLPTIGIDLTGWVLNEATGISFDGTAVTGWGNFNHQPRGFFVTGIPAPSAAVLLGGFSGALAVRRRR